MGKLLWAVAVPVLLFIVALSGCAHQAGTFTPTSYHQDRYGYDVRYLDPAPQQFLSPDWRLDNYYEVGVTKRAKSEAPYRTTYEFDTDGDGTINTTETMATYDLRFEHMRTASVIWIRSLPVPTVDAAKDLHTLMLAYIEASVGAGYEGARIGRTGTVAGQRFTLQVVDIRPARLAGKEAMAAVVDVGSLDPAQMQTPAARKRIKLVLVRTTMVHDVAFYKAQYPVFIVAGYASQPELFEQNLNDLHAFLNQVVLGGYMGYGEQAPSGPAAGAPDAGTMLADAALAAEPAEAAAPDAGDAGPPGKKPKKPAAKFGMTKP